MAAAPAASASRRLTRLTLAPPSLCVGHDLELQKAALLLLLEELAPLLDVDVVPGKDLGHGPRPLAVPGRVDVEIAERLPPGLGLETLPPAVEPAAAPPGFLQRHRHAAVTAREHALQEAAVDVMLLDLHRAVAAV